MGGQGQWASEEMMFCSILAKTCVLWQTLNHLTMFKRIFYAFALTVPLFLSGCLLNEGPTEPTTQPDFISSFNFRGGNQNWTTSFAEYMDAAKDTLALQGGRLRTPITYTTSDSLLGVRGKDNNKDLFLFFRRKVDGLKANTMYRLEFQVELVAHNISVVREVGSNNQPKPMAFFKVGALAAEPTATLTETTTDLGYIGYKTNFSKGNHDESGNDLKSLGAVPYVTIGGHSGNLYADNRSIPITTMSNASGELWLIMGFDANLRGEHAYYISQLLVYYTEI